MSFTGKGCQLQFFYCSSSYFIFLELILELIMLVYFKCHINCHATFSTVHQNTIQITVMLKFIGTCTFVIEKKKSLFTWNFMFHKYIYTTSYFFPLQNFHIHKNIFDNDSEFSTNFVRFSIATFAKTLCYLWMHKYLSLLLYCMPLSVTYTICMYSQC